LQLVLDPDFLEPVAKSPALFFNWEVRTGSGCAPKARLKPSDNLVAPDFVPSRPNSPHSAASAQLKTRMGRGSPSGPRKIWPREWKTLVISGKISGQEGLKSLSVEEELDESIKACEAAASENAAEHLDAIQSNTDGSWIDAFLGWQEQFTASNAAESVNEAFNELQTEHAKEASRLESEARKAFRERKTDEGWELYRKIVDEQYASPQYRTLKERVKKHFVVTPTPN
jgi:hypothetical protein